jgi:hypothetical protein
MKVVVLVVAAVVFTTALTVPAKRENGRPVLAPDNVP